MDTLVNGTVGCIVTDPRRMTDYDSLNLSLTDPLSTSTYCSARVSGFEFDFDVWRVNILGQPASTHPSTLPPLPLPRRSLQQAAEVGRLPPRLGETNERRRL